MEYFGVNKGMPRKKERFEKCVYKIYFNGCDKIYIGSSTRWPYRRREHLCKLKSRKHRNQYLQRAANKYGIESIVIEPIEFCENSDDFLREREQYWINVYDSSNPKKGYNLVKLVTKTGTCGYKFTEEQKKKISLARIAWLKDPSVREEMSKRTEEIISKNPNAFGGKFKSKKYTLLNPQGKLVEIENLNRFCRKNNLNYKLMADVASGKRKEHDGWKNPYRKTKTYSFISPKGEVVTTENVSELCRKENIPRRTMFAIHGGVGISCLGWRKYYPSGEVAKHKGKNYLIENETGEILQVNNLTTFCRENGLCRDSLRKGIKSKGFKLLKRI